MCVRHMPSSATELLFSDAGLNRARCRFACAQRIKLEFQVVYFM